MSLQKCIPHTMEYLQSVELANIFDLKEAKYYYRKHNGVNAHPFYFGLKIADYLIYNHKLG